MGLCFCRSHWQLWAWQPWEICLSCHYVISIHSLEKQKWPSLRQVISDVPFFNLLCYIVFSLPLIIYIEKKATFDLTSCLLRNLICKYMLGVKDSELKYRVKVMKYWARKKICKVLADFTFCVEHSGLWTLSTAGRQRSWRRWLSAACFPTVLLYYVRIHCLSWLTCLMTNIALWPFWSENVLSINTASLAVLLKEIWLGKTNS